MERVNRDSHAITDSIIVLRTLFLKFRNGSKLKKLDEANESPNENVVSK